MVRQSAPCCHSDSTEAESFIDSILLYKAQAQNSKLRILRAKKSKKIPPMFSRHWIFVYPGSPIAIAAGTFEKMPFVFAECTIAKKKTFCSMIKHPENGVFTSLHKDSKGKQIATKILPHDKNIDIDRAIEIHKAISSELNVRVFDFNKPMLKREIQTMRPSRFEKTKLKVEPAFRRNGPLTSWVFEFEEGFRAHLSMDSRYAFDDNQRLIVNDLMFDFRVVVGKRRIELTDFKTTFKGAPQDITPYWSKAHNAATTYIAGLNAIKRAELVKSAFSSDLHTKINAEKLWNKFKPSIEQRPITIVEHS